MNGTVEQFKLLLEKYKLSEPTSPEQQDYIIQQRQVDLKALLKKIDHYRIIFWLSVLIYSGLKKFGITVTLIQSKIILGITAITIASGSGAGVYTGTKYIIKELNKPESKIEEKIEKRDDGYKHHIENKTAVIKDVQAEKKIEDNDKKDKDAGGKKKRRQEDESEPVSDVPTL